MAPKLHLQNLKTFLCYAAIGFSLLLCADTIAAQSYIPGNTYYDSTGFVKYLAGNLPVVISAPHGGSLEPSSIPDRNCSGCSYIQDAWTQPVAEGMYDAFYEQTGCYPHVIVNLLHRVKFDANRDIGDAADGNPTVEEAWYGYHALIDSAKNQIIEDYGRGLFLDLHGHGHDIQRIELGYLLSGGELRLTDAMLNTNEYIEESSIRTLTEDNLDALTHAELLRGLNSFGTLLDESGLPAVPSSSDPYPEVGDSYFSGGYNTVRHGSRDNGGNIDAIQIECNQDIRFNATRRAMLIQTMPMAVNQYIALHYYEQYAEDYCNLITSSRENIPSPEIEIFPNPANDFFNIKSDLDQVDISIFNCLGQKVASPIWSGAPIDIKPLERGTYFVQLRKEGLLLSSRVLIKS